MHQNRIVVVACLLLLSACEAPPTDAQFDTTLDTKQLMGWVLDPSADVIWESAGTVDTMEGREELAPTTAEGWANVRNHAAMLVESGNLLQLPERSRGADWDEYAQGLSVLGHELVQAAQDEDEQAIFDLGGELYNLCVACHQAYPPADANGTSG